MKNLLVLATLAIGCSGPVNPQIVSGHVAPGTYDHVVVTQHGNAIVSAPVSAAGAFKISIPPGASYRLELVAGTRVGLIHPRKTGTIKVAFRVRGNGAPFDLGMVRSIGDATTHTFAYSQTGCQDGTDGNGDVCVDDNETTSCGDGSDTSGDNTMDGSDGGSDSTDGETAAEDNSLPGDSAVADHNLPETMGCGEGDSGGDHQNEGDEQGDH